LALSDLRILLNSRILHLNVIELKVNGLKFNWDLNNLRLTRLGDHWRRLIAKNRSLARRKKLGLSWACQPTLASERGGSLG